MDGWNYLDEEFKDVFEVISCYQDFLLFEEVNEIVEYLFFSLNFGIWI